MLKKIFKLIGTLSCIFFCSAAHYGPKYQVKTMETLDRFGINLAKKYDLTFLNSGSGILVGHEMGTWALNFTSCKNMKLEEARPLAVEMVQAVLSKMYSDPLFANYIAISSKGSKWLPKELDNTLIGFKISFWDKNVDRPLHPYLAQVRFAEGKVHYHYADPKTQALQEPIVETLNDLKINPDSYLPGNKNHS